MWGAAVGRWVLLRTVGIALGAVEVGVNDGTLAVGDCVMGEVVGDLVGIETEGAPVGNSVGVEVQGKTVGAWVGNAV